MTKNVSVDTKSTQENISMHTQIISQRITQKINEEINKEKQDEYSKLLGRQNAVKYQISEKYSVGFYILAGYAIFRYYEKGEYGTWETDRDSVLERLSEGERKILSDFEAEKKEIFKEYEVYIM